MMFIIRGFERPPPTSVVVKVVRRTPAIIPQGAGKTELRDGWYEDDTGGGIAISGHGKCWEVRDTPFTVRESGGLAEEAGGTVVSDKPVNVRGAVFGV